MKKAILTLIFCLGMVSLIATTEHVTFLFCVDYTLRLCVIGWSGNRLAKLDKKPTRA